MNADQKNLIAERFKNTALGLVRIKRNLDLCDHTDKETELFLRKCILESPIEEIVTRGKNHYFSCRKYNAVLTIHKNSLTIITAKPITKTGE